MHKATKIFLIGFMGSGKSTTGRELASFLKWSFIDLDEKIEKMTGMKISEIFSEKGEDFFRKTESEALHTLATEKNAVISTGGGTPCFSDNMDFMLSNGLTVYLRMTPAVLANRLADESEHRPLLKDIRKKELQNYIAGKLSEREKWYSRAEITVDGFNTDLQGLCSLVKKLIKE
jgi:shikimate kinase